MRIIPFSFRNILGTLRFSRPAPFVAAVLILVGAFGAAHAQNARIHHQIIQAHQSPPAMGRDFWFAMPSNYWGVDNGGKYMRLYITSPVNTTAYVQIGGGTSYPVPVVAYKVGVFQIKESWEMESSGYVEPKGIHVWSNDADLTCYVMSHNAYTSDGSYIIPTVGLGTDYVVAGYGSLYELSWDDPSEFTITATMDNTKVDITPSCDFRLCPSGNESGDGCSRTVGYGAGRKFSVILNRGESVQYKPVLAQGADGYDVTGTILHSNYPIGVIGGCDCPNIPADFPYCDHVEDMIPPTRTWATTYYTTNFVQPPSMPGHDFGLYLMVASKPGQTIWRRDYLTGTHVECQLTNQYDVYWDELESAQKFWSNAPFLLVEYINSSTYPDHNNGAGDPAEIIINPKEQYTKTVVFQTPVSVGAQAPYDNYANIIVRKSDEQITYFDKQFKILTFTHQPIDDTFEIFNVPHIAPGVHTVTGDTSGVGVYIYGYGYDESYGWAGNFGTGTFHSKDTVAPLADTSGQCYDAYVHFSDSGVNPGNIPQSTLNSVIVDSDYNMSYIPDPKFHTGIGLDTSSYSMFVINRSEPAYLSVSAFDFAGNETTVISTYTPQTAEIVPPVRNLGQAISPTTNYAYDTIINTGQVTYTFDQLHLLYGNLGFKIDSGTTPSQLLPGEHRVLKISFQAVRTSTVVDSIIFGDECGLQSVAVIGSGGAADFLVTDQHWFNEPVPPPPSGYIQSVKIENLSTIPITIDSAWWVDKVHFQPVDTFPVTVPATDAKTGKQGEVPFRIAYFPDKNSLTTADRTRGFWHSSTLDSAKDAERGVRTDSLIGNGIAPAEYFVQDIDQTVACAQPGDTLHLTFQLADTGTSPGTIERIYQTDSTDFKNLQGILSSGSTWIPGIDSQTFAPGGTATITLDYPVPVGTNVTAVDSLTAINSDGNIVGGRAIIVTVHVIYKEGEIQPPKLILPASRYQQAGKVSQSFTITNIADAPLDVNSLSLMPGGNYNSSFTYTTNPPIPTTLAPDSTMTVTVIFNDSLSFDAMQSAIFQINSGSCTSLSEEVDAPLKVSGAAYETYTAPPVLACDQSVNNVKITNTQPGSSTETIIDTVISAMWVGSNHGANFTIPNIKDTTFGSGDVLIVPVTFTPSSSASGLVSYSDTLAVELRSSRSDTTLYIPVNNTAGTALVTGISQFATPSAAASDQVSVPATVKINTLGLPITVDNIGITGIQLTYVIPHPDLLIPSEPNPFTISPALAAIGWSASRVPNASGERSDSLITILLTGTQSIPASLDSTAFGNLNFEVALDKGDDETAVNLQSIQLFTGQNGATPVGPCIATATQSGDFSLVLRCGDSTLKSVMLSGAVPLYIEPATPDPVTGPTVKFDYANRGEGMMTLAIYDVLGREVARPLNNVPQDAGSWEINYDASKLPNGTYTYRLSENTPLLGETGAVSRQFVIQR